MAYYNSRNPPTATPKDPQYPGPVNMWEQMGQVKDTVWDTIKAPLAGLWQGLGGKNRSFEQYLREKMRKQRGMAPGSYPGRGLRGWLGRTITGK